MIEGDMTIKYCSVDCDIPVSSERWRMSKLLDL